MIDLRQKSESVEWRGKFLVASNRPKMLYRACVGLSFLEKKTKGCHELLTRCWRTAPKGVLDSLLMRARGAVE